MKNIYRFALMLVVAMFVIGSIGCGAKVEEAPAADAATENAESDSDAADTEK